MGSGIFPIDRHDGGLGTELADAARRVEYVATALADGIYSGESGGMQFDNAASDGAYLHRLRLAVKLIRECVKEAP